MHGAIRNPIKLFTRDQRGVSSIEFAMIAPIILTLMLGAYDIGNAVQQQIALQEAVRSGGEYAVHFPTNPTAVQAAVMSALPAGWTLTNPGGVPVVTCKCTNANGTTTSFDCTTTPPCGAPMMVSITATMAYTTVTSLFASAIPSNSATYVARFN